jgi:hypothetical protein
MMRASLFLLILFAPLWGICDEGATSRRSTERSFLLLWPKQPDSAYRLNLDEPLAPDRPDFTEASSTVGKGVTQAELGYTYYYDGASAPHGSSHVYPELLLRQGVIADWLEMRVGQTLVTLDEPGTSSTGFADMYLGVKVGIVPQFGVLPELSIVPQMTVPSGSHDLRADHVLPGINFLYSWSVFSDSYLGASTQINQREGADSDDLFTSFAQALVVGTRWNETWGSYLEWFALFADSAVGGEDAHYTNAGMTYLISNDIQLDIRFGSRLQDRFREEIFAGAGFSVRYF